MQTLSRAQSDYDPISTPSGVASQELHPSELAQVKKRSVRGALTYAMRSVLLYGISIGASFLLAAFLTREQFGVYGVVVAICGFFTIISDIGLAASLIQKSEAPQKIELRTTFTVQQILAWVVCGLIVVTALFYAKVGKIDKEAVFLAGAFALSFPIVSLKTISSILLERELRFDKLVIPALVEAVVFNTVVVVLAWKGFGLTSYTVAVLCRSICGVIAMFSIKRWEIGFAFSKTAFLTLMRVGGKFQLNDMLAKMKDDLFFVAIAFFLPVGDLGYINWANRFSKMPYSFTVDSVMAVTFPTFSRLQGDPKRLGRAIEKTLFFVTLFSFPLLVGFALMLAPFTLLIPAYHKWQPALLLLFLLTFNLCWSAVTTPLVNTLNAIGKINLSLRLMLVWTFLQWTLTPLLIWRFGFVGVGLASALISFSGIYVITLAKQKIPFDFFAQVWRQLAATAVMSVWLATGYALWSRSMLHILLAIFTGGLIYVILIMILGAKKVTLEVRSILEARNS